MVTGIGAIPLYAPLQAMDMDIYMTGRRKVHHRQSYTLSAISAVSWEREGMVRCHECRHWDDLLYGRRMETYGQCHEVKKGFHGPTRRGFVLWKQDQTLAASWGRSEMVRCKDCKHWEGRVASNRYISLMGVARC